MALTGTHIVCLYAGGIGNRGLTISAARKPVWSQTMAAAGITVNAAPEADQAKGEPLFMIDSAVAIFCAIAPNPDATAGARIYLPAGEKALFYVEPGDRFAWVAA